MTKDCLFVKPLPENKEQIFQGLNFFSFL